jgi:flagellar protein FlaG
MRITGNQNMDMVTTSKAVVANNNVPVKDSVGQQGSKTTDTSTVNLTQQAQSLNKSEDTKGKVQEAVTKMNEMLDVNNSTSKFMYHEGLERYYVTVVDRESEEVVKEIPPKKLLDAFYEMQKMLGMIVDEKI